MQLHAGDPAHAGVAACPDARSWSTRHFHAGDPAHADVAACRDALRGQLDISGREFTMWCGHPSLVTVNSTWGSAGVVCVDYSGAGAGQN